MSYKDLFHPNADEFGETMELEDLVAVHLTDHFPKERTIRTLNSNFPLGTLRNTIHVSINHPVQNITNYGNWDGSKYAVIAPLDALCQEEGNNVTNFNVVDTYFLGDVKLPKGSTVIVAPSAYSDIIEEGIVDRNHLMSVFGDERNLPNPEDKIIVEKDGITYVVLSWNSEGLRDETYHELSRQGYACMKGGMWNWGNGNWGADPNDQARIARKIGAKTGNHCNDLLASLEHWSGSLSSVTNGRAKDMVLAYARKLSELGKVEMEQYLRTSAADDKVIDGLMHLEDRPQSFDFQSPNQAIECIRTTEEQLRKAGVLTDDLKQKIDRFIEGNVRRFRAVLDENPHLNYKLAA